MKKKYTHGEIAKIILKSFIVGGLLITILALPGLAQVYTLFKPKTARERYRVKRTISELQKQKVITIHKKNNKEYIGITHKGRRRLLTYQLENTQIKKQEKWDGLWRIITFDIPENKKQARNAISKKLKKINFYPLQKSVLISPYPCKDEIDFISHYFNVEKYVVYIEAKNVSGEIKIKKYFNLS